MRKLSKRARRGIGAAVFLVVLALAFLLVGWVVTEKKSHPGTDVDVIIYGTQTAGIAALDEIKRASPDTRVAVISSGNYLETPLAQGLYVEDLYRSTPVHGFYKRWREGLISYYRHNPGNMHPGGQHRLTYEHEASTRTLWGFIDGGTSQTRRCLFYAGKLTEAVDEGRTRYAVVQVDGGRQIRLNTKVFIDASVEADLARMLGADYSVGLSEKTYNDKRGPAPELPTPENGFITSPQKMSILLTLGVYPESVPAPAVAALKNPDYNPSSYKESEFSANILTRFKTSWTMTVGMLPNDKRELNEAWNDWPDDRAAFSWMFRPSERPAILKKIKDRSINYVRFLQENGYPEIGISKVPDWLYVREGPRIRGKDKYTEDELTGNKLTDPIAVGAYAQFDRHHNRYPTFIENPTFVYVPMGSIMADGHPWLLVPTAISSDTATYCSAVRMEPTRANMGGAAGVMTALALDKGIAPGDLAYPDVRSALLSNDYVVDRIG